MKQWRAPLNKAPSKIGKEEQRPGEPKFNAQEQKPKMGHKGQRNKLCSRASH